MIHTLLMILKIIGIILLVLLAIILTVLLLVIFVPFKYRIKAGVNDAYAIEKLLAGGMPPENDIRVNADVSWLLGFLKVSVSFVEKKLSYCVRVAAIKILGSEKKEKSSDDMTSKEKEDKTDKTEDKDTNAKNRSKKNKNTNKNSKSTITYAADPENAKDADDMKDTLTNADGTDNTQSIMDKDVKATVSGTEGKQSESTDSAEKVNQPKDFSDISAKFESVSEKVSKIIDAVNAQENRDFVVFILGNVKKLLWHLRPRKHEIDLYFGADDPSVTGQAYGAYSVVNTIFGLNFRFIPDFEKNIIHLTAGIQGHLQVLQLLVIGIKILTNKTFRKLIGGKK